MMESLRDEFELENKIIHLIILSKFKSVPQAHHSHSPFTFLC